MPLHPLLSAMRGKDYRLRTFLVEMRSTAWKSVVLVDDGLSEAEVTAIVRDTASNVCQKFGQIAWVGNAFSQFEITAIKEAGKLKS